MTVENASRASAAGNGSTVDFSASFRANSAAEVGVITINDTTHVVTTPVLNTDYTVTLNADTGAPTVTFDTAPASGITVILYPKSAVKQETDLDASSALYGTAIEAAIDKMAAQLQALEDLVKQKIGYAQGDGAPTALGDGAVRASTFITFNSAGVLTLRDLADVGL